jgi:hypothetical protein
VDQNQPSIVEDLRAIGASVQSLASVGKGCPDLLVGFRGSNYVFEVKNPDVPPSRRQLTPDEIKWHERWRGSVYVIHSFEEAFKIIKEHDLQDIRKELVK